MENDTRPDDRPPSVPASAGNNVAARAVLLLRTHIETSKTEVRKITIHKLHEARLQANRRDA